MAARRWMKMLMIVAWFALGIAAPLPGTAGDYRVVRGIVEYTDKDILTIGRNRYDVTGVPVRNLDGSAAERDGALRGKLAEILYFKGKIVSVKISPPMPE